MEFNRRFPVLSTIAKVMFILGCITLVIGLGCGVIELLEFMKLIGTEGGEWHWEKGDIIRTIVFVYATFAGLVTMAIAEIIGVLFAIEKNTRS